MLSAPCFAFFESKCLQLLGPVMAWVGLVDDDDDSRSWSNMIQDMSSQSYNLFLVQKAVFQMLRDRGYCVEDHELEMTREQFAERYGDEPKRNDLDMWRSRVGALEDHVFVRFPPEPKVGIRWLKSIVKRMTERKVSTAIIVLQERVTAFTMRCVDELSSGDLTPDGRQYHIQFFMGNELLSNVKNHVLIPEHVVLTSDEKQALLERYNVKETQLPRIQLTDPIARYFGMRRGQVVKIVRPSETAGKYVTYRIAL